MSVEHIEELDTLNQGRLKINAILDQSNASAEKVDAYQVQLTNGISEAKNIADEAGKEAVQIATDAGNQANETANQAMNNAKTAITIAGNAVSTANNNKQEFDTLRNDFDQLVAEAGDSNPEIVQARTDTQGIKQATLANRLQIDLNDRMTKADGISLLAKPTTVKMKLDFNGKTAGNTATNANSYSTDFTAKILKKPTDVWEEVSQADYNKMASRDDEGVKTGSTQSGVIPQQLAAFNLVEAAKKLIPQMFETFTTDEAVAFIRQNVQFFTINQRVKAAAPNNQTIKIAAYLPTTDNWVTQIQESAKEFGDFSIQINDQNFITDEGFIYLMSYTDSSNGVTPASLEIDYMGLHIGLSVDAQAVLAKSGFVQAEQLKTHVENQDNPHQVTAEQVGLGNVENYGFASDSEAVAGTLTSKYMHPKNVAEAIKGQAVTQTGDQEIAGVKNFSEAPLFKNLPLVSLGKFNLVGINGTEGSFTKVIGNMNNKEVGFGSDFSYIDERTKLANLNKNNNRLVIEEDGMYILIVHFWVQPITTVNGYWYFNFAINGVRAGGPTDRFWGLGGSSWKNRQDGLGMVIRNFKKGDQLSALIETNYMGEVNSTGIKSATLIKIG